METLDVLITASSRPELINYCYESVKKNILFSGDLRFILHEDFVFPEKSEQVLLWAKEKNIDMVLQTNPAKGLGFALMKMLGLVTTKYCFYLQEDWEFERYVDIDQLICTMESDEKINSVIFNKNRNQPGCMGFQTKECLFDTNLRLCTAPGWFLLPAIWRTDFIRSKWKEWDGRPEGAITNVFGSHEERSNPDYVIKNMGTYFYGGLREYRYVRHLGDTWRMAKWRLEENNPGGSDIPVEIGQRMRAPWLEPMPKRPSNKTESGWYPD